MAGLAGLNRKQVNPGGAFCLRSSVLAVGLRISSVRQAIGACPRCIIRRRGRFELLPVNLTDDVLDRIDEIVTPATTINLADNGWVAPSLDAAARRRPTSSA